MALLCYIYYMSSFLLFFFEFCVCVIGQLHIKLRIDNSLLKTDFFPSVPLLPLQIYPRRALLLLLQRHHQLKPRQVMYASCENLVWRYLFFVLNKCINPSFFHSSFVLSLRENVCNPSSLDALKLFICLSLSHTISSSLSLSVTPTASPTTSPSASPTDTPTGMLGMQL